MTVPTNSGNSKERLDVVTAEVNLIHELDQGKPTALSKGKAEALPEESFTLNRPEIIVVQVYFANCRAFPRLLVILQDLGHVDKSRSVARCRLCRRSCLQVSQALFLYPSCGGRYAFPCDYQCMRTVSAVPGDVKRIMSVLRIRTSASCRSKSLAMKRLPRGLRHLILASARRRR